MSEDAELEDFVEKRGDDETQNDERRLPEIDKVPDGWDLVTVEEISEELIGGGTPSKSNEEYWGGSIPWASVKDLGNIKLAEPEDYITEAGVKNSTTNVVPVASVIISTRMTVGEPFLNTVKMAINQDMKAVVPNSELLNPLFLVYALWDKDPYLKSLGRGTTVDGITTRDLSHLHLGLPSLEEQKKIASILYTVDQAIQKNEDLREQTNRVKNGLAQEFFHTGIGNSQTKNAWMGEIPSHWDVSEFSKIVDFRQNGIYKEEDSYGGPYPIIKMGDIFGGVTLDEPISERVHLEDDEIDKYATKEGDLVFARHAQAGWGAGDCTYIPMMDESVVVESNMVQVRLNDEVDPLFYAQYFNSEMGAKSIKRITTTGNIKSISQGDLMNLKVPIPPIEEQEEITRVLSTFDDQIERSESEVKRLQRLKKGLMRVLISGEMRTHDKDIEIIEDVMAHA